MSEQTWLDALKKAKYSGALEVRQGDKSIKYRSLAEMNQAIAQLEASLGVRTGSSFTVYSSKGL